MSAGLRLSPIAVALSFGVIALPTLAQQADETMVITADRFGDLNEQLMVVNVIDRDTIDTLAPKSVTELLARLPGVTVTNTGGAGQTSSVLIRGAASTHTLVLVDGVRISSATLGVTPLETLAPEQIERIEVLKGPRAAIWGSDAIGGVIQIFTRKLEQGQWIASAEGGSHGYGRASAGVGIGHGAGHTSVSINREQSDGFNVKRVGQADADGYERTSLAFNGEQQLTEQWQMHWRGQVTDGHYQYDYTPSDWGPSADETDYLNYHYLLAAEYENKGLTSKLQFSHMQDKSENSNPAEPSLGIDEYRTQRDQISWLNQYRVGAITLASGMDWYNESVAGDFAQDSRDVFGVYALARYEQNSWLAEGVIRYDDISQIEAETSYQASLGYRFTPVWQLVLSHGTGFKVPTFNDLYWPGSGNPDLVSEYSENWDLTLRYNQYGVNAYVSGFYNEVENLIQWAPIDPSDFNSSWLPMNVANAKIQGAELGLEYQRGAWLANAGYTYTDAKDADSDLALAGRSRHQADLGLGYLWDNADLRADYHYQGTRESRIAPYHLIGLSWGYQLTQQLDMRIKANNIFDEEIISSQDYYGPGREYFVTLSYKNF